MTAKPRKKKKPRELTVAQKLAFRMPINQARSEAHVPPPRDRMGVKVNV